MSDTVDTKYTHLLILHIFTFIAGRAGVMGSRGDSPEAEKEGVREVDFAVDEQLKQIAQALADPSAIKLRCVCVLISQGLMQCLICMSLCLCTCNNMHTVE